MAPTSTTLTSEVKTGTPYQLDVDQVTRAATALVKHIQAETKRRETESTKLNLLADGDEGSDEGDVGASDVPVWVVVTTKKHILDKKKLKPGKIAVPHSIYTNSNTRICLITADPQRTYKDIVAHPSFPDDLSSRIGRVIGLQKLKAKYKSYESRRQLLGEYDIFLADDRIITRLPLILGKVFYKSTTKRPISIHLMGSSKPAKDAEGKKIQNKTAENSGKGSNLAGTPTEVGTAIQKTFQTTPVHLSPSATTAIRVAYSSFTPNQIAENVTAVVNGLADKFISKGWRNIRAVHIKGPNTAALPVWLASELWVDEQDVLDEKFVPPPKEKRPKGKKRGAAEMAEEPRTIEAPSGENGKDEAGKKLLEEIARRKEKLKKQKQDALEAVELPSKKVRKTVAVA